MKGAVVGLVALGLVGCAPMVWDRPGSTQQDFVADDYACRKDVRQSEFDQGLIVKAIETRSFYSECMTAHGWTQRGTEPVEGSPAAASTALSPGGNFGESPQEPPR